MNPGEIMRIVDSLHRDKEIPTEIVFEAIESALVTAARRYFEEEDEVVFLINRENGTISGTLNDKVIEDPQELIGRVGAQTAKQVIIQKIREAERDRSYDEFIDQVGDLVNGVIHRADGGGASVNLGGVEASLPRSEQIPGESHRPNDRVQAMIVDVQKKGSRVSVVLSRTRPQFVQQLFEQEIPEISDEVIHIRAISREAGCRTKIAVDSYDERVDCVGACVGVRGNRIKNIIDELSGERIDIVRFDEDPLQLIPNALQPAEVNEVILCQMMGRAIVLVREDQLSLAIGRRGQNVRLASKLCAWDIEIMTQTELEEQINNAIVGFSSLDNVTEDLANQLVGEGYLSYDDLSVIEPESLMEMGDMSEETALAIMEEAENRAEEAEVAAKAGTGEKDVKDKEEAAQGSQEVPTNEANSGAEVEESTESDIAPVEVAPSEEVSNELKSETERAAEEPAPEGGTGS
ncbi:MAG: transcription termination factor NusA [Pirellulaceae bacterium]|nr:transcription termination factor NusA [Pirellulaceae bacterium]